MDGKISYVLTYRTDASVDTIVQNNVERMWENLLNCKKCWPGFWIIHAQRIIASGTGDVRTEQVWIDYDAAGINIYDRYDNILASYFPPEPEIKTFRYRYTEMWQKEGTIQAASQEEADEKLERMSNNCELMAAPDGELIDIYYEVINEVKMKGE